MEDELEVNGATVPEVDSKKSAAVNTYNPARRDVEKSVTANWDRPWQIHDNQSVEQQRMALKANETTAMHDDWSGLGNVSARTDILEAQAANQGWWNKLGKGAVRLAGETAINVLEIPGTLAGAAAWAMTGEIDNMTNNWWVNLADDAKEKLHEALPQYQSRAVREGNVFDKMTDMAWWMSEGVSGASFMVSAFAPGMGLMQASKFVSISRGLKALKGNKITRAAFNKSDELLGKVNGVRAGAPAGEGMKNGLDFIGNTAMNTVWESGVEARGVHQEALKEIERKHLAGEITDAEKAALTEQAARNAASTFKMNVAILSVPNAIMSKHILGPKGGKTKFFKDVTYSKEAGKFVPKASEEAVEKGIGSWKAIRGMEYIGDKAAVFGKNAFREGVIEEGGQMATEKTFGHDAEAGRSIEELTRDFTKNYLDVLGSGDGQAAILLSGVLSSGSVYALDKINKNTKGSKNSATNRFTTFVNHGVHDYQYNYYHGARGGMVKRDEEGNPLDADGNITTEDKAIIDSEKVANMANAEAKVFEAQEAIRKYRESGLDGEAATLERQLQVKAQIPFILAEGEGAALLREYLENEPAVDIMLEDNPGLDKDTYINEQIAELKQSQADLKHYTQNISAPIQRKHLEALRKAGTPIKRSELQVIRDEFDTTRKHQYIVATATKRHLEQALKEAKEKQEDPNSVSIPVESLKLALEDINLTLEQFTDPVIDHNIWVKYVDDKVRKEEEASPEVESELDDKIKKTKEATSQEEVDDVKDAMKKEGYDFTKSEEKAAEDVIEGDPEEVVEEKSPTKQDGSQEVKDTFQASYDKITSYPEEQREERFANFLEEVEKDPDVTDSRRRVQAVKAGFHTAHDPSLLDKYNVDPVMKAAALKAQEIIVPLYQDQAATVEKKAEPKKAAKKVETTRALTPQEVTAIERSPKAYRKVLELANTDKKATLAYAKKLSKAIEEGKMTKATLDKKAVELGLIALTYPESKVITDLPNAVKKAVKGKRDAVLKVKETFVGTTAEPKTKASTVKSKGPVKDAVKTINKTDIRKVLVEVIEAKEKALQEEKIAEFNAQADKEQIRVAEATVYGKKIKEGDQVHVLQDDRTTTPANVVSLFNSKASGENALVMSEGRVKIVSTALLTKNPKTAYDVNNLSSEQVKAINEDNNRVGVNDVPGSAFDDYSKQARDKSEDRLEFQFAISNITNQLNADTVEEEMKKRLRKVRAAYERIQGGASPLFLAKKGQEEVLEDFINFMPITIRTKAEGHSNGGRHIATQSSGNELWSALERTLREQVIKTWIANDKGLKGHKGQKPNVMVGVSAKWAGQKRGDLNAKQGRRSNILKLRGMTVDTVELFTPTSYKGKVLDEQGQETTINVRTKDLAGRVFMKIKDNRGEDFFVVLEQATLKGRPELDLVVQLTEDLLEGKVTKKDKLSVKAAAYLSKVPGLFDDTANTVTYNEVWNSLVASGRPGDATYLNVEPGTAYVGTNSYSLKEFREYKKGIKSVLGNKYQNIPFKSRNGGKSLADRSFKQYILESGALTSNLEEDAAFFVGDTTLYLGKDDVSGPIEKVAEPMKKATGSSTKEVALAKGLTMPIARAVARSKVINVDNLSPEGVKFLNKQQPRKVAKPSTALLNKIKGYLHEDIDENCG